MRDFFVAQNEELKQLVNRFFWDESHGIYNDLDKDGRPITELQPGVFCKHVHMFWPLMAGFATPDRAAGMVKELKNPASFNRLTGVPSLSADSAGYNTENGQYWRGAVWPPTQCMVQEGLKQTGHLDDLQELAEKIPSGVCGGLSESEDAAREHGPGQNPRLRPARFRRLGRHRSGGQPDRVHPGF